MRRIRSTSHFRSSGSVLGVAYVCDMARSKPQTDLGERVRQRTSAGLVVLRDASRTVSLFREEVVGRDCAVGVCHPSGRRAGTRPRAEDPPSTSEALRMAAIVQLEDEIQRAIDGLR